MTSKKEKLEEEEIEKEASKDIEIVKYAVAPEEIEEQIKLGSTQE